MKKNHFEKVIYTREDNSGYIYVIETLYFKKAAMFLIHSKQFATDAYRTQ